MSFRRDPWEDAPLSPSLFVYFANAHKSATFDVCQTMTVHLLFARRASYLIINKQNGFFGGHLEKYRMWYTLLPGIAALSYHRMSRKSYLIVLFFWEPVPLLSLPDLTVSLAWVGGGEKTQLSVPRMTLNTARFSTVSTTDKRTSKKGRERK